MWANLVVAIPSDEGTVTGDLIRKAFYSAPEIENILLLLPKELLPLPNLLPLFAAIPSISDHEDWSSYNVYICTRDIPRPALRVRLAKVEDHDDLVPIFNKQSEVTPDVHSQFMLAKIIAEQNESTKTLVAEVNFKAVGILSMTTNIQLEPLQNSFYMERYGNLVKTVNTTKEGSLYTKTIINVRESRTKCIFSDYLLLE